VEGLRGARCCYAIRDLCTNDLLSNTSLKNVLECSFMLYKLRFSAWASCVALPPASMQSCALASSYVQGRTVCRFCRSKNRREQNLYPCKALYQEISLNNQGVIFALLISYSRISSACSKVRPISSSPLCKRSFRPEAILNVYFS